MTTPHLGATPCRPPSMRRRPYPQSKRRPMNIIKSAILAGALAAGIAAPAAAQERVKLGMLDCVVEGRFQLRRDHAQQSRMHVHADPSGHAGRGLQRLDREIRPRHRQDAEHADPLGGDRADPRRPVGRRAGRHLWWRLGASHAGGRARAPMVLVGGWENSIALQPVSLQSQEGVNIAVGIAQLRLTTN